MLVFLCVCFHVKHFFFINHTAHTQISSKLQVIRVILIVMSNTFLHSLEGARMKTLNTARIGQIYYVNKILKSEHAGKLRELGFTPDKEVVLLSIDEENARLKIGQTRLALSSFYLNTILIKDEQSNEELVPLSSLNIGQSGVVRLLEGQGEIKRRLMDMGITRGTSISVHKLAPLGDPMELHLRGYSLSLRKKDAEKIKIVVQD